MSRLTAAFVLALFVPLCAAADEYNETAGSGFFINSVPSGAKVFIDGVERGTTPYSVSAARTGEYDIRLAREGYVERRFRMVIRRNSRVEVTIDMEEARGQVLFEVERDPGAPASLPFAPQISADGSRIYPVPGLEQAFSLPEGWRNLAVEAFGWERQSKTVYVGQGTVQKLSFVLKPAVFAMNGASLRKKRFNPRSAALGRAEVSFEVNGPGRGLFEVLDEKGKVIYSRPLGPFTARQQQAVWTGRDQAGAGAVDGGYTLRISLGQDNEAGQSSGEIRAEFQVILDSSLEMRPLTLSALSPGLLLAPSPEIAPVLSYQIEGTLMAGKPLLRNGWESLPYAAGIRVSLTERLEAAAAFNAAPGFDSGTEWGAGASVKWAFLKSGGGFLDSLGAAAELSYGWATAGPYTPFGMGTGAALRLPLSYRLFAANDRSLDLLASPLVLWAGPDGYPDSAVPRLGFETGTFFSFRSIAAGLSFRWDYAPSGTESGPGPLASALEAKWSLSNFVISALGGFWYRKGSAGAFFGAGFGVMY